MSEHWIWVKPDQDHYTPGDEFCCTVHWNLKEVPEQIDVSIFCAPRIKDDLGGLLSKTGFQLEFDGSPIDEHFKSVQPNKTSGTQQIRFSLPEGPHSYRGKYLTIAWHVKVAAKGSNLGTSDFYVAEFVVSPGRVERNH